MVSTTAQGEPGDESADCFQSPCPFEMRACPLPAIAMVNPLVWANCSDFAPVSFPVQPEQGVRRGAPVQDFAPVAFPVQPELRVRRGAPPAQDFAPVAFPVPQAPMACAAFRPMCEQPLETKVLCLSEVVAPLLLPSLGSGGHHRGDACQYCHICPPGEHQRRKKAKLAARRAEE